MDIFDPVISKHIQNYESLNLPVKEIMTNWIDELSGLAAALGLFECQFYVNSLTKTNQRYEYVRTKNKPGPTISCCDENAFDCPVPDGLFPCSDNCSQYFICEQGDPRYVEEIKH